MLRYWKIAKSYIIENFDSIIYQAVFWLLTFLLAAFASVFSTEIKAPEFNRYNITLILSTLALACFFAAMTFSRKYQEKINVEEIKTNPPHGFWETFSNTWLESANDSEKLVQEFSNLKEIYDKLSQDIVSKLDALKDETDSNIKKIIGMSTALVEMWDQHEIQGIITYRANIMTCFESPVLECKSALDISDVKAETTHQLVLQKELCIALEGREIRDDNRENLILPVLSDRYGFHLPGAPTALHSRRPDYVANSKEIPNKFQKETMVMTSHFLNSLQNYYHSKNNVGVSILSIPLLGVSLKAHGEQDEIRHVLNIYRDKPNMLYAGRKVEDLCNILKPIIYNLETMMYLREDIKMLLTEVEFGDKIK